MGDKHKISNQQSTGNQGAPKDKGSVTPTSALICGMGSIHNLLFKTLHTHWNAKGSRFLAVHEFTEKQYNSLLLELDSLAERLRALDAVAPTDMETLTNASVLREDHLDIYDASKLCRHLADAHQGVSNTYESFIRKLSDEHPVSADLFTQLAAHHEKVAWMYKALID
jgi:starvation-inducible DNA-binding protein